MKLNDIELLERIAGKYKFKYEVLDSCFENTVSNALIYVPINITLMLSEIKEYGDSLDDRGDFYLHCAITVMNLFAHYKHYYMTRQASRVVIIGFVKDSYFYKQFQRIISIIENICEFMPNIYFMGDVAGIKHTIFVGGFLSYINSATLPSSPASIHVYSGLNIDKQLLCLFPSKEAYKICKPMNSGQTDFLSKRQFIQKLFKNNEEAFSFVHTYKPEIERLSVIIGIFFGSYECYSSSEKSRFNFTFNRDNIKNKSRSLLDFFQNYYDKSNISENMNAQALGFLKKSLTNPSYFESLKTYVNRYDYFYHEGRHMHNIMKELYNAYKVKILDYEISKESEKYRLLTQHPLYSNWLLF
jgi:hypothetical protein